HPTTKPTPSGISTHTSIRRCCDQPRCGNSWSASKCWECPSATSRPKAQRNGCEPSPQSISSIAKNSPLPTSGRANQARITMARSAYAWTASPRQSSVVALEDHLLLVPANLHQAVPVRRNHVIQPTNVGMNIEHLQISWRHFERLVSIPPGRQQFGHMVLHIPAQPRPAFIRAAQAGKIMKVRMPRRQVLKIFLVINLRRIARSIDQPDIASRAAVFSRRRKQMLRKTAHRSDSRPRRDKDAIDQRLPQRKQSMRPVKLHFLPRFHVAKPVGEESTLHPVHAKVKAVSRRGRRNRIGARLLLAGSVFGNRRNKLARDIIKGIQFRNGKFKVEALCGLGEQELIFKAGCIKLACQNSDVPPGADSNGTSVPGSIFVSEQLSRPIRRPHYLG